MDNVTVEKLKSVRKGILDKAETLSKFPHEGQKEEYLAHLGHVVLLDEIEWIRGYNTKMEGEILG